MSKRTVLLFMMVFLMPNALLSDDTDYTKRKLTKKDLEGKTLQELYLMRNTIFARHGRPFKDYELFSYFMGKKWYKPDRNYSIKKLSKTELKNVQIILEREKELLKKNYTPEGITWGNIVNKFEWGEFTKEQKEKICKYGFVVTPARYEQIYHIYEENDYAGRPSFITTDAILELFHLFFDFTLRKLEEKEFFGTIKNLTDKMKELSLNDYNSIKDSVIKEAARRNIAFFSVPQYFLTGDSSKIPDVVYKITIKEIKKCNEHTGFAHPTILNPEGDTSYHYRVDYSQFIPRGHYTRNDTLKRYFLAMMWYGTYALHINLKTKSYDNELIQALLITHHLYSDSLLSQWKIIYDLTSFYVGHSDDLGPEDIKYAMDKVFGRNYSIKDFANGDKLKRIKEILKRRFEEKTKIRQYVWETQGAQFRFMGQRYIPDSEIMQRLTVPEKRIFPKGLDLMAVFGSNLARDLMLNRYKDSWKNFPGYPDTLSKLTEEFGKLSKKDWRVNLYYNWFWCLKSLLELSPKYDYPFFMKNKAWEAKDLNAALSSWSELRHDVILYAKHGCVAECGGEAEEVWAWVPDPPKGYVEPNVEFYSRIKDLLQFTVGELKKHELLTQYISLFNRFSETVDFLLRVSEKELKNEPRTIQEYEQIRRFGALLENLSNQVKDIYPHVYIEESNTPDMYMPVIADVHTGKSPEGPILALEEGVGFADEIWVVVEIDGRLRLMRGGVFSYYEFLHPASDRLTDEKWQKMLKDNNAPAQPDWTRMFKSKMKKTKIPKPTYIPEYIKEEIGKKKSGWYKLYYDSGC